MLSPPGGVGAYLARNLRKGQLKVTAADPIPVCGLVEALEAIPENICVIFRLVGADGYYYRIHYEVFGSKRERIDYVLPYRPATLKIEESELAPLLSSTPSRGVDREEDARSDVRAFKAYHRTLDLGGLRVNLRDFCLQFPVLRTESTLPPLLYYKFREYCGYGEVAQHFTSYDVYYTKLKEFYREPVSVGDFCLQATDISLSFCTWDEDPVDENGILQTSLFRTNTSPQRVKFCAYVFVQFAFCDPPKTAWDDDSL